MLAPRIVKFDGPQAVACRAGETKVLEFEYATKNATAVRASIDRHPVGAPPSYPPARGTIPFGYTCPGPHTLTLTAVGAGHLAVSSSFGFDKSNHASSATSQGIAVASG